jgi:hypothetical protein
MQNAVFNNFGVTREQLRERYQYDAGTGVFTRDARYEKGSAC